MDRNRAFRQVVRAARLASEGITIESLQSELAAARQELEILRIQLRESEINYKAECDQSADLETQLAESQERERKLRDALANSYLVVSEDRHGWFAIYPHGGSAHKPIAIFEKKKWADTHCEFGNEFNMSTPSQASAGEKP